jgi:hypothetical protein
MRHNEKKDDQFLTKNLPVNFCLICIVVCKVENSSKDLITCTFEAALNEGLGWVLAQIFLS